MTRDEIMKLEGRELDKEIAEKVMGLSNFYRLSGERYYGPEYQQNRLPDYSSDISAAYEVAERFNHWQLTKAGMLGVNREYRAIIDKNQNVAYASTGPLAICRAALLAVMEDDQ